MLGIFDRRPWGWMVKLLDIGFFWIKIIYVRGRTSMQYHHDRDELHLSFIYWHYVPREVLHWLDAGLYLELAWGRPREHDIVRVNDLYGRT